MEMATTGFIGESVCMGKPSTEKVWSGNIMRAIIHHGKAGAKIEVLLKRYEFEYPEEFYGYIFESYVNGHKEQVIELFNEMNGDLQKSFLMNCQWMGVDKVGDKIHDLIIQNL
jgi:hypothetical protein